MTKLLTTALLTVGSAVILSSCGGGGDSSGGGSVRINSFEVKNQYGETNNPVIYPNEEFYIKWDVKYSGSSSYHVDFFASENKDGEDYRIAQINCGFGLTECSKGIKCRYYINSTYNSYEISCSYYTSESGWTDYGQSRRIYPDKVNYITAEATVFIFDITGSETIQDKTSVPVRFMP